MDPTAGCHRRRGLSTMYICLCLLLLFASTHRSTACCWLPVGVEGGSFSCRAAGFLACVRAKFTTVPHRLRCLLHSVLPDYLDVLCFDPFLEAGTEEALSGWCHRVLKGVFFV